ncbi:ATP-binding cassette subfamily B protein [Streptomyces aurantiacus]|uniref:ABC transporter ATP-binding protein/permease n=1 Tax=Streptomyces aurantiacus TaxID=47760 RepID=UPI00279115DB|nr:ABC transporter ATP-binding protein/permease [Streptomyces aurantiacus]MDQ0773513.1 ATP-binding cassette subfamily B protein [Streptomyces aurantiacus]
MTLIANPPAHPPVNALMARHPRPRATLSARSILPGRQRWDLNLARGRPALARLTEASLRRTPGIEEARVNPVTGRVLLRHDRTISPREAARSLRRAVDRVLADLSASTADLLSRDPATRPARHEPATRRSGTRTRPHNGYGTGAHLNNGTGPHHSHGTERRGNSESVGRWLPKVFAAGAVAATAVAGGPFLLKLLSRPLLTLGLAAAATAGVVRRAWRRADGTREQSGAATPRRHAMRRIIGRHKRKFGVAAFLSGLSQLAEMALFALTPSIVLLVAKGGSATLAGLGVVGVTAQLATLAGAAGVSCLAMAASGYGAGVAWRGLAQDVEDDWRTRTYAHIQNVAPADLENERVSRVNSVLSEDISQLGTFVSTSMHDVVQLGTSLALLVPMFLLLAPQIAWVAFAPVPIVAWLSFRFHERAVAGNATAGEHRARLNSRVTENLNAHTTVKAATTEEHEIERVDELNRKHSEVSRSTGRSAALPPQILRLAGGSALVGTVLLGGGAVLRGELPTASFGPLIELPGIAMLRLSRLGSVTDQYQRTLTALDRVERLHELPVEPVDEGRPLPVRHVRGKIELRGVTFSYPGRPAVLRDTSLVIPAGGTTAIVGTTGAGKTTIAKLLMRFRHPDRGRVLLDGTDVRTLALPDLRRAIGYVTQEPFLFDATIAENIGYGTFHATEDQLVAAARTAGADTFIDSLPEGYATRVGERGASLSGGQKQRIALARTVLRDPPVIILDEATSAIDNETEAAIQQALQVFGKDRTTVVIAHRLSTVQSADRIYVMGPGGLVAEQGTHEELVRRGGIYNNLWKLQVGQPAPA